MSVVYSIHGSVKIMACEDCVVCLYLKMLTLVSLYHPLPINIQHVGTTKEEKKGKNGLKHVQKCSI